MKQSDNTPIAGLTICLGDAAKLFGVSKMSISNWVGEGMPRSDHGRYPLVECVRWRLGKLAELAGSGSDGLTAKREQLLDEQIVAQRMENEVHAAELLVADEVQTDVLAFAAAVASALDALPARAAARLATMGDPAAIQAYLRQECNIARQAAADGLAKYASELGAAVAAPAKAKRGRPTTLASAVKAARTNGADGD